MDRPLIIIQARTGSTRLPNKMTLNFYKGKTIPEIIIESLKKQFNFSRVVLATSKKKEDDVIEKIALKLKINCFRGDENNVLKRFIDCAETFNATKIIRICSDNPFINNKYIKVLSDQIMRNEYEYISFKWDNGDPVMLSHIGVFAESMTLDFLKKISNFTNKSFYQEHVTNFLYENRDLFNFKFLKTPSYLKGKQNIRLTVDTKEDFNICKELYKKIMLKSPHFEISDLLELIDENSSIITKMQIQIKNNAK